MKKTLALQINLFLAVIGGSITLWVLLNEPSETQAAILWSFSLPRLLILLAIALVLLSSVFLFLRSLRGGFWTSRIGEALWDSFMGKRLAVLLIVLFLALYFSLFMTDQKLGSLASYRARLYPLLVWLEALVIQFLTTIFVLRARETGFFHAHKEIFSKTLLVFALLGLLVLFIAVSKVGLRPDVVYWQEAGVPLLIEQVLLAWGIGVGFYVLNIKTQFETWSSRFRFLGRRYLDLSICILIWVIAFSSWTIYPLKPSYTSLEPRAPNFQSYPFGDALIFDINAQYYLIGRPIPNDFWQKPFYSFFLAVLHMVAGQNYDLVICLQVSIFALIPVLAYLLAKTINNRPVGLVMAFLLIFREINAFTLSNVIQVSHSRILMSDVFSMGLMVTLTYMLIIWLKNPESHRMLPMAVGGILGLLVLTRGHALLLFPFILLASAIVFLSMRKWRSMFAGILLLTVGLSIPLGVWMWRSVRWTGEFALQDPVSPYTVQIARLYSPTPLEEPMRLPGESDKAYYTRIRSQPFDFLKKQPVEVMRFVSAHYAHNMIYSFVYLPASLYVEGAVQYVKRLPFWKNWEGFLPNETKGLLIVNLLILALGFSALWEKSRHLLWVPLLMGMGYNLSVSVGRLSGWRLIMPADWITLIFYSAGLMQSVFILRSILRCKEELLGKADMPRGNFAEVLQKAKSLSWQWSLLMISLSFFFASLGLTFGHRLFPIHYPEKSSQEIVQDYKHLSSRQNWSLTIEDLQGFLSQNEAVALYGRGLYPSYLPEKGGELNYFYLAFAPRSYKRLVFQLIGPEEIGVVLPLISPPSKFPNAAEVLVFGCRVKNEYTSSLPGYIDALAVVVKTEPPLLYLRATLQSIECPFSDFGGAKR